MAEVTENTKDLTVLDVSKSKKLIETSIEIKNIYPSNFYDAANILRCPKCGEKKRTALGETFCPVNNPQCSFK
jgi:predicted nucleic acid-binding protein